MPTIQLDGGGYSIEIPSKWYSRFMLIKKKNNIPLHYQVTGARSGLASLSDVGSVLPETQETEASLVNHSPGFNGKML